MAKKKVIIVGAGPGGLTSAMILAHRGFDVTVCEAKDVVGGRNAPLRLGEFTFDTGPTFLMMSFILEEMFREAGESARDHLEFRKLDPLYRLKFDDCELFPSSDPEKMEREISRVFPGNEGGLKRFLETEKKRFEMLFPCIQKDYSSLSSLFALPLLKALPYIGIGQTLFENLGNYFREDELKVSFTFQAKYIGMSPWKCPKLFTILSCVEHLYGIYHVTGGLNAISRAMEGVARKRGADIRLSTPVKSLILDGRKVKGVRLESGDELFADEVILNADFAHAMSTLVPEGVLKKYSPVALKRKEYSCSTFMLYLGLDRQYDIPHHNIFFAHDYKANVEKIFHGSELDDDMSFYIQNACVTDPTLAPAGKSTIYVLVPVQNLFAPVDWESNRMSYRNKVLDAIEARTELKDIRKHIVEERIITPADWKSDHNVYQGATFNLSHMLSQMLYLRPRNKFEELDNCWLVGGGTHPGSGLPTIYESARISSNLLCRKHRVAFETPSTIYTKKSVEGQADGK